MKRVADRLEEEPHIARDFYIGGTHVKIATNYCEDKTPEDVQAILDEIARKALPYLVAQEKEKIAANGG